MHPMVLQTMKTSLSIIFSILLFAGISQTKIESDSTGIHRVILSSSVGVSKRFKVEKTKYNYSEVDSVGNYTVLGNLNSKGIPNGQWKFFLGDVTPNGEVDWCSGSVKDAILEGKWLFSWFCVRFYEVGIDRNPNPCPNI